MFDADLWIFAAALGKNLVAVKEIKHLHDGYQFFFDGLDGDAIIHSYSYGNVAGEWETMGFPWDHGDVSTHDPITLAKMIGALQRGEDWTKYDKEDAT